jgi:hypothetical protein
VLALLLVACLAVTATASLESKAAKQQAQAKLSDAELQIERQRLSAANFFSGVGSTLDTYGKKLLGDHYHTVKKHTGTFSTHAEPFLRRLGVHVQFVWKYVKNIVDHLEAWILKQLVNQKHLVQDFANKDVARVLAKIITAVAAVSIVALVGSLTGGRRQQPRQERRRA